MASPLYLNVLQQARSGGLGVVELVGAAEQVRRADGVQAVSELYKVWIESHATDPLLYAVLFNYSTILTDIGLFEEALAQLEKAAALNPDFMPIHINLGRAYERQGQVGKAAMQWSRVTEKLTSVTGGSVFHKITALNQMARVLEANNQDETVENFLSQSLELDTTQREVVQHYIAVRQRECLWPVVKPQERVSRETLMKGISPLSAAVYADDPMLQLALNWYYNLRDVGMPKAGAVGSYWAATKGHKKNAPLRIGYLSSDLREHAIGFLTSEIFGLHDRSKVEIFAYYCGIPNSDATMERIKGSVDHWVPITGMDDETAARRIADDGIQILVDVNGYTRDGRTKLVALRPAPVIVNWLGFPGSMGSPYHHYIIADDWIIPPESEIYYSEKVLRLPCYQPNDRQRVVSEKKPTRAEMSLPDDAMVYCCFNGTQKISPFTFDRWLTILGRVPGSVLWLLGGTETSQKHLRDHAKSKGIAPERLVFAGKMKNPDHLARYPLADLFLDTAPYGAHTTASDALWMGVPVVTLSGRSFASRVCGSLVRSAGLPDLACTSADEFVDRAVALGRDRDVLNQYRAQLAESRESCILFDTPLLVRKLEELFDQMWKEYKSGSLPQPDLQNLDVYLDVGIEPDFDQTDVLMVEDYEGWWQDRLASRHAYRPLPCDDRLWGQKPVQKAEKTAKRK